MEDINLKEILSEIASVCNSEDVKMPIEYEIGYQSAMNKVLIKLVEIKVRYYG